MQNTKFCIENNIARCKNRKKEIDIEMAKLQREREVIDNAQTDFEIILDHYMADNKEVSNE